MIKKVLILMVLVLSSVSTLAAEKTPVPDYMKPHIMVVSVSSDGDYAITTDLYKHAVLWDLKNHTYKIVAKDVNVYSGYFIEHTHDYMYQDDANNEVVVKNVDGKTVKQFNPGFPTYGQVMTSNLQNYFASDVEFNVFKISGNKKQQLNVSYCFQDHKGKHYSGPLTHACTGFEEIGKLLNLMLSNDEKTLTGSGDSTVYIWSITSGLGKQISKNDAQTFATISPDGRYVVSGDANGNILKLGMVSGKVAKAIARYQELVLSIKFLDADKFLVVYHDDYDAGLFSLKTGKKIKSIQLLTPKQLKANKAGSYVNDYGNDGSFPVSGSYVRDQAIDTSPSAHVLVMAMSGKNGILVYHYNPTTQTLKQVWAGVVKPKSHHWWHVW